jgi:hypothetical protein
MVYKFHKPPRHGKQDLTIYAAAGGRLAAAN